MAQDDYKIQAMLFDYGTTARTDYRAYDLGAPILKTPKRPPAAPTSSKPEFPPLKDLHTMTDWKVPGLPFDTMHGPRPINGENPRRVQKPYFRPKDDGLQHAIETRPRRVMTPAVVIDDIKDSKVRDIVVEDMYTSETAKALKEAERPYFKVQAPFSETPSPIYPIPLPAVRPPAVPREWRLDSVAWDSRQLRAYCDSTKRFWLGRELDKCNVCEETRIARDLIRKKCLKN